MSLYSKRRGRRSLAAIAAAMLMASVLAVVAGSPAQAANTSFEVKIDHDGNAATATVREFAGQDRYDTALRLAKNFATSKGGLGAVPAAFVSSGQTLVDSISVAGLAGYVDAPIVLTPTDSLHGGVANFIEDYGVDTVYVLGGSAAVADSVVTAIEGLTSKPKVTRIAGDDRYATAAATASMIDAESSWCGTEAASAVLINGASDMISYGVAVQTIASRLQLPVLMTAADELPEATAEYITENRVEHVQIIGGTGAVSADVAAALTTLGVDTVMRVEGDSAAAVSVALAKLANNGCGDALGLVSNDRVALVRGNPDGVVAAPVLASSLAGGYLVPPLVVGDSLPASVSGYLAATPKTIGANKLNLGIVAIGGTAAVSEATMDAALAAAASSGVLSVEIGAAVDTTGDGVESASDPVRPQRLDASASPATPMFTLYFSDDVAFGDATALATLLGQIQDIIEVNGVPAVVNAVARSDAGGTCDNRRIDVTLGQPLSNGDTISVVASGHKLGTNEDQRTLAPASTTVVAAPPDRVRPTASVLGIAMAASGLSGFTATDFTVTFSDAGGFPAIAENSFAPENFAFSKGGGSADATISGVANAAVEAGAKSFTVTVTMSRDLAVGDRLTVKAGVVSDRAQPRANKNASTPGTAIKAQASPRINAVQMSNLRHSAQNAWTVPSSLVGGAASDHLITISAKAGGPAAGAAGNGWAMVFDRASTHSAAKPLDIDVRVDTKGQRVTVRFVNGPATATLGDLLAALKANADFDSRFSAGFADCALGRGTTPLGLVTTARDVVAVTTNAGRTQFAIEVRFNAWVHSVSHDELLADVLAAAAQRAGTTNNAAGIRAAATGDATSAGGGLSLDSPAVFAGPSQTVRYEGETALMRNLPQARDLVITAAGHTGATAITGPPAFPAITAVTAVATGYAADAPTGADNTGAQDKVDEDKNGSSQQRIIVSSSVKARR